MAGELYQSIIRVYPGFPTLFWGLSGFPGRTWTAKDCQSCQNRSGPDQALLRPLRFRWAGGSKNGSSVNHETWLISAIVMHVPFVLIDRLVELVPGELAIARGNTWKKSSLVWSNNFTDERSREKTYTLRIDNGGMQPVTIHDITPRIPENVELVEIQDVSSIEQKRRREELCAELSRIVNEAVIGSPEVAKSMVVERRRSKGGQEYFFEDHRARREGFKRTIDAEGYLLVKIDSTADARNARQAFMEPRPGEQEPQDKGRTGNTLLDIYDLKLSQQHGDLQYRTTNTLDVRENS